MLLLLGHSAEEAGGGGERLDQPLADTGGGMQDIEYSKYNSNKDIKWLIIN